MATTSQGLDDFIQQLKAPRFIKIYVGDQTEPYEVPESTLVNASDYFAKALKHEHSLNGSETGVLRFAEDGEFAETWKIILYWIVHRRLPKECGNEALSKHRKWTEMVQTWVLGDKYLIPGLQDAIMVELLSQTVDGWLAEGHDELYTLLQISPVGTKLRRLLAEESILWQTNQKCSQVVSWIEYLEGQDGAFGLTGSTLAAYESYNQHNDSFPRIAEDVRKRMQAWEEYLIGTWPRKAWIFRDLREAGMDLDDSDSEGD